MIKLEKGLFLSPGFAEGPLLKLFPREFQELPEPGTEEKRTPSAEEERLEKALCETEVQLKGLRERAGKSLGEDKAGILDAHVLMLRDPEFLKQIRELLASGVRAENAVVRTALKIKEVFDALPDPYLRERGADLQDVATRLFRNLLGEPDLLRIPEGGPWILVTPEVAPSEAAALDPSRICGIVTERGGAAGHTALVAQALGIPAVSGFSLLEETFSAGRYLCVNGKAGEVLLDPSEDDLKAFRRDFSAWTREKERLERLRDVAPLTRDGTELSLWGNIASPDYAGDVRCHGGTGVGLFRTEFLFMGCQEPPGEEEQYLQYSRVLEELAPFPVVIRTMDAGGDKDIPFIQRKTGREANPFLGYRAIRICLEDQELFGDQIRALLRGALKGNLWLMFPMITGVEEIRRIRSFIRSCGEELDRRGVPWAMPQKTGIMVETPAAVMMARELAREVDFFSVGTNDLTQYTLACDRMNSRLASLYDPLHPGVLRLLAMLGDAAESEGIALGMCGELAGEPLALPLLLGLGFRELSMTPAKIPALKERVLSLRRAECLSLAERILSLQTAGDVRQCLESFAKTLEKGPFTQPPVPERR